MKVMHVIDSGGLYGAEVMLLNLMHEQRSQGLQPVLASIGEYGIPNKPLEHRAEQRGFKVRRLRMRKGFSIRGALSIVRTAREEGCSVLHTHGYKGNILLGSLPSHVRGMPSVATLHGWTGLKGQKKLAVYQWLDAQMLRRADAVVLVNRAITNHRLFRYVRAKQLVVIDNGIPFGDASPSPFKPDSAISDFCKKSFVIGSIGRLSEEKGYIYLIQAFALLHARGVPAKLLIIGEGCERARLAQEIRRCNLVDHVLLPGYREAAADYISLFDVFVLPSLTEGLPLALLEAMAKRTPIVATRVGGVPDVVADNETGLLVPPQDRNALADAVHSLYSDPATCNALRQRAHYIVRSCYDSERMAQQYLAIYSAVLNTSTPENLPLKSGL